MYGRNAQQLIKRQDSIKVHVFYKRDGAIDNIKNYDFWHYHLGLFLIFVFISTLLSIFLWSLASFYGLINSLNTPKFSAQIFFSLLIGLLFFEFDVLIGDLDFVFFCDYKFSFIINESSLIHEIIHGYIFEKFQAIKKWEVWVIDGTFWCFGYVPKSVRFPNFILNSMMARSIHLIHDLISSFIACDIYAFFDYIKEFFTIEKNWIKELKTQIKRRKT